MPRPTRLLLLPCAAVLATMLVGCSSDGSSDASADPSTSASATASPSVTGSPLPGAAKVCAAGVAVSESIHEVNDHLQARDLDATRTSLGKVKASVEQLQSATADLSAEVRATLKPRVQEIGDQLDLLEQATSLDQLQSAFAIIPLELKQLLTDIDGNVGCSQ